MRVLVFGTCYCRGKRKLQLLEQWAEALQRVAPGCDQLVVDSNSPSFDTSELPFLSRFGPRRFIQSEPSLIPVGHRTILSFPDNVGHLSAGGRDGWGRAFSQGLLSGIAGGYDYVVHVEGDLLTRLDLPAICRTMREHRIGALAAVTPKLGWLETGLMFLEVGLVRRLRLVERYDWAHRIARPYPEVVLGELLGDELFLRLWRGAKEDTALLHYRVDELHWMTKPSNAKSHDIFMAGGEWPATGFTDSEMVLRRDERIGD